VSQLVFYIHLSIVCYVLGNHSCSPNAEVTFPDNNFVLTVKALSHIKSGEVIICFSGFKLKHFYEISSNLTASFVTIICH